MLGNLEIKGDICLTCVSEPQDFFFLITRTFELMKWPIHDKKFHKNQSNKIKFTLNTNLRFSNTLAINELIKISLVKTDVIARKEKRKKEGLPLQACAS